MSNAKSLTISILVALLSFIAAYYHAVYTGDIVANIVGYFASMAILPAAIGFCIGCLGVYTINNSLASYLKPYWWLPALGIVASLAPAAIYIIGMSVFHE